MASHLHHDNTICNNYMASHLHHNNTICKNCMASHLHYDNVICNNPMASHLHRGVSGSSVPLILTRASATAASTSVPVSRIFMAWTDAEMRAWCDSRSEGRGHRRQGQRSDREGFDVDTGSKSKCRADDEYCFEAFEGCRR